MLLIEYPGESQFLFEDTEKTTLNKITFGKKGNIVGTQDIAIAMMTLTTTLAPFITKIIIELIKNKREITIKMNGNTIAGLSEKTAEKIITDLIENND